LSSYKIDPWKNDKLSQVHSSPLRVTFLALILLVGH
jgi:hypothetical protein